MAEFDIQGLDPVLKKLRTLMPKLQKKALRSAGTKAMKPVRDAARAKAKQFDDPASASNIAKNIVTRYNTKASKRVGGSVTQVGVAGGARPKPGREDTGHWRYLEFGRSNQRAQPFMRSALSEKVSQVTNLYVESLSKDIDKIIAKGGV